MRDNDTITRKVCADGNKLCPGKNGGYIPSRLGGRLISVDSQAGKQPGGQAGRQAVRRKSLRFDNFNHMHRNRGVVGANTPTQK